MRTGARSGEVVRQIGRLWEGGPVAALGEDRLLERFAAEGDGPAFEALVARHGPMVLGTCRRMLGDGPDSEDAFQATFLVLARKAGTIRDADRLGPWLHGVARRVARRSRAQAARRRSFEGPGGETQAIAGTDGSVTPEAAELRAALDEELGRLPEKYRAPLVLCYLEGLTHDEAAARLRWPVGTVRSRLAGGRDRLRGRLARRGLSPSAAPAALPVLHLPTPLLTTTVRLATMAGTPSAPVASLAKGAMLAMMIPKLKLIAALGLLGGLATGGAGAMSYQAGGGPAEAPSPPAPPPEDAKQIGAIQQERARLTAEVDAITARMQLLQLESLESGYQLEHLGKQLANKKALRDQWEARWRASVSGSRPAAPAGSPDPLEAANERIKQLEAELAGLRAKTRTVRQSVVETSEAGSPSSPPEALPAPPVPPAPPAEPGPPTAVAPVPPTPPAPPPPAAPRASQGFGRPGMSGGGSGMATSNLRETSNVMNLVGTPNVLVIAPNMERIMILNTETGARDTYRVPQGATQVTPTFAATGGGLMMKGPEIRQVVAFDAREGRWYPQDLREPVKDVAYPAVSNEAVLYRLGKFLYVFSIEAKKWSTLELKGEGAENRSFPGGFAGFGSGKMILPDGDQIHIYNAKNGEWTHIDTKEER